MKQFYLRFLLSLLLAAGMLPAGATHFMGVDISYECTGPCTYRIIHKSYYDCTGGATSPYVPINTSPPPPAPGNFDFQITGNAGCAAPTPAGNWVFVSWTEVTPICPSLLGAPAGSYPTGCNGSNPNPPINGVGEAVYYRDFNFCNVNCTQYTISWDNCCRNSTIDSGAADEGIYSGQTIINLGITPCNSSPAFVNPPVPYICAGQLFTFNQGALDPDGDSLSYELGNCFAGANMPVSYDPGFSPQQPLGPTWSVSVNPLTGDVTMTPNPTGSEVTAVMCIVVKEWRNGIQIGQVTRDMQITVISSCSSSNPLTGGVTNVNIGVDEVPANPLSYNEVRTCAGVPMCFDIPVISQDPNLNYTISWNQGIPGATFTDANNPAIINSVTGPTPVGRFCWTPPANAQGAYFFVVTVNDDACPIPGFNQFTIIVLVDEVLNQSTAFSDPVGCNEVELTVLPVSTIPGPYSNIFPTTNWNGNGNLNLNPNIQDSSFSHLYPAPGTYFYTLQLQDTFGCQMSIPGIVNLATGATADAGPDITICSNFAFTLGTPAIPGQTYLWTPDTLLSSATVSQPAFVYPNGGLVQSVFNYVLEVSDGICTTFDYTTVAVNPSLEAFISPSAPEVCPGDTITLTASSNLGSGNTYLWSTGETTASIQVSPLSTTAYSVVSFNSGCSSNPAQVTVSVREGPQALLSGNPFICPGGTTTLTAVGGTTYLWSAGGFTQPSITLAGITQDTVLSVVAFDNLGCVGPPASITVRPYESPLAAFLPDSVCEGLPVLFADRSSVSTADLSGWSWDFGDGSFSDLRSPSHVYASPGLYPVTLIVETNQGCLDTAAGAVEVFPSPDANFTFTNVCEGIANQFNDSSVIEPGGLINSYAWDFGDSNSGSGSATSHTYGAYGFYNVTLTASTNRGCSDSRTRTVFVNPNPIADFAIISACEDSVVLASTSSTVPGVLDYISQLNWDFGHDPSNPANFSTELQPSYVYPSAGQYVVTLSVTTANGCTDQIQREVAVYPQPVANFEYDNSCENELTVFLDRSTSDPRTPVNSWFWDLGNTVRTLSQDASTRYQATGPGVYRIVHGVRTNAGCVDTVVRDIVINPQPRPFFTWTNVCFGDSLPFVDGSEIASGSIAGWDWDFGDGQFSTLPNPAHFYGAPGEYNVLLTVRSDSGCINTRGQPVTVYALPEFSALRPDTVCFSSQATLAAISATPGVTVNWYHELNDPQPFHTGFSYTTPVLPFDITYYVMPVSREGCINERQPITAHLYPGHEAQIRFTPDAVEIPGAIVTFQAVASRSVTSWAWSFGNGETSVQESPVHEYAYPGRFEVILTTTDEDGCTARTSTVVEVKKIVGVYLPSAFTPNGDDNNDLYRISYYNINRFAIRIFNRWGQLVFESDNPDFTWNGVGLQGQPVREGVYVYEVNAFDLDGNEINESGTITVIR